MEVLARLNCIRETWTPRDAGLMVCRETQTCKASGALLRINWEDLGSRESLQVFDYQ